MDALDEGVLRDDGPSGSWAASFAIPCARPRRSSSASRPTPPISESLTDRPCVGRRADDGDSERAGVDAVACVARVDPADRDHGHRDGLTDLGQVLEPDRRVRVRLSRRLPDGAGSDVRRSERLARLRLFDVAADVPSIRPSANAISAPESSRPRCTPSAPSAIAACTSSFTTNVAPSSRKEAPTAITSWVDAPFRRSWTTVAPPSTATRAVSKSLTIACSFTSVRSPRSRRVKRPRGRGCRARRRGSRGTCRGPSPPARRPPRRPRRRREPRRPPRGACLPQPQGSSR